MANTCKGEIKINILPLLVTMENELNNKHNMFL
jgi:hypothetical protein